MRDPDERTVHCLEAINQELHEMNKQLKIANQISILSGLPFTTAPDIVKKRAMEIVTALNLA